MAERRKFIITCAVTGSIHTPSMSPYLPVTPQEVADAAVGAAEAGAAIVHLHARDPVDGSPTQNPKYFREFAPQIRRRSNVVLNFTTGGAATMTIEERLLPLTGPSTACEYTEKAPSRVLARDACSIRGGHERESSLGRVGRYCRTARCAHIGVTR